MSTKSTTPPPNNERIDQLEQLLETKVMRLEELLKVMGKISITLSHSLGEVQHLKQTLESYLPQVTDHLVEIRMEALDRKLAKEKENANESPDTGTTS